MLPSGTTDKGLPYLQEIKVKRNAGHPCLETNDGEMAPSRSHLSITATPPAGIKDLKIYC